MEASLREVSSAYEEGRYDSDEFDASVERILRYKELYAAFGLDAGEDLAEDISRRKDQNASLMKSALAAREPGATPPLLGDSPFFAGCLAYRSTIASARPDATLSFASWFAEKFGGSFRETTMNPNHDEITGIVSALPPASSIVMGTFNGHLTRGQIDLAHAFYEAAQRVGIPLLVVTLRNPWDLFLLPQGVYGLAAWEYSLKSFEAIAAVFRQELSPGGSLPRL
jgi:beta-N-acetylhexosaminidase